MTSQLPENCLKSSATTDGAKNELGAAFALVNEDNAIHCVCHNIQLCVNDPLDEKKANPPPSCQRHRAVKRKLHDLVIFINTHKEAHEAFLELARAKRKTEEGARMFESLVEDVVTRWDSELAMMERAYYFDREILELLSRAALGIPADMALNRFEFDLMYAMTLVLAPIRVFTKFAQHKSAVTLAYVPKKIDDLISALAPGSFTVRLQNCHPDTLAACEAFQAELVASLKQRFAPLFDGDSLALAARYFLPGKDLFVFENFDVNEEVLQAVRDNILGDVVELLPPDTPQFRREGLVAMSRISLQTARAELDNATADEDPLLWWPLHPEFTSLYSVAKMYLQIPASSAENERSFSSASFILDPRRTRLDLDNFRREHRLRRFLLAGDARDIARDLMVRYADTVEALRGDLVPH